MCQFSQIYNYFSPWLMSEFCFRSVSWERIDGIWPSLACALILTRPRWDWYTSIFTNLWQTYGPSMSEFCFHSISWEQIDVLHIPWYWQDLGWNCCASAFIALGWCQNFVSAQFLENKLKEFDRSLHMHLYWEDGIITHQFSQIFNKVMALDWSGFHFRSIFQS